MKCNQCGAEAPASAAFCSQCGAQVGSVDQESSADRMQPDAVRGSGKDAPEHDLWSGAYSPKAMTAAFLVAGLLTVAGIVVASIAGGIAPIAVAIGAVLLFAALGLRLFYKRMSVQYRLTTHRLVLQKGILSRIDDRILLVDVDDITVRQGVIDRLLNLGTIILNTSDESTKAKNPDPRKQGTGLVIMSGIENPRHIGDLIDEARRTERSRRGLYMINA